MSSSTITPTAAPPSAKTPGFRREGARRRRIAFPREALLRVGSVWLLGSALTAFAQTPRTTSPPPTDTSVQASPAGLSHAGPPATDASAEASPLPEARNSGLTIAPGTSIQVKLVDALDSGHTRNGQSVAATLTTVVNAERKRPPAPQSAPQEQHAGAVQRGGRMLPAGMPVTLTVIAAVPVGQLGAAGEISLQVLRVGSLPVFTETQTFHGKPGHQDLPDSAPAMGTNATLAAGAQLTFTVQKPPS